jgi:hypothetical protein
VIQHIVLYTPKAGLTDSDLRSFAQSVFRVLSGSKDISRACTGRRATIDAGYERSFGERTYKFSAVLEFEDEPALIRYLNSADHAELGRLFWQTCADTVVLEVKAVDAKASGASARIDELV